MRFQIATLAGAVAVSALAACSTSPRVEVNVPAQQPTVYSTSSVMPVGIEYGRVASIDYFPGGVARTAPSVPGAVLGAVAGALIGNQIGAGSGRAAATVLGGAAGAAVGSQAGRTEYVTEAMYRVTVQTESGVYRAYDVPATGDLRIGDRVRIDNGVIYLN